MAEFLAKVLPYALPPLLGAVIGWVTNAIAIRMLFRPLTEKRFLGMRIPFTPGIIPRQRFQLAESIGNMVSTQLFTAETVRSHIDSAGFREGIEAQVSKFTSELLDSVPIKSDIREIRLFGQGLEEMVKGIFTRFLKSERFELLVADSARRAIEFVSSVRLRDLVPRSYRDDEERSVTVLSGLIDRLLSSEVRESVVDAGVAWVRRQVDANVPIGTVLSDELIARLTLVVSRTYNPLLRFVIQWLHRDEIKLELTVRGQEILRNILLKLNFFQRFLVTATQYDKSLKERMPDIVDDLLESLREAGQNPANKARILNAVSEWLQKTQATGLADAVREADIDIEAAATKVFSTVAGILGREDIQERLAKTLYNWAASHADDTVGDVLEAVLGLDSERTRELTARAIDRFRRSPTAAEKVSDVVVGLLGSLLGELRDKPLQSVIRLEPEQKAAIDAFATDRIFEIIDRKLPEVVESFDVYGMVVNKINGLDIESVEKLLLMVIARHLRFINLFGALLGALIGGAQVLVGAFI